MRGTDNLGKARQKKPSSWPHYPKILLFKKVKRNSLACYLQHSSLEEEEQKCLCTSQRDGHVTKQNHCNVE